MLNQCSTTIVSPQPDSISNQGSTTHVSETSTSPLPQLDPHRTKAVRLIVSETSARRYSPTSTEILTPQPHGGAKLGLRSRKASASSGQLPPPTRIRLGAAAQDMSSTTLFSEVRIDNEVESPTAFSMKTCLGTQQPDDYWPLRTACTDDPEIRIRSPWLTS
jgi:hypothetical protein